MAAKFFTKDALCNSTFQLTPSCLAGRIYKDNPAGHIVSADILGSANLTRQTDKQTETEASYLHYSLTESNKEKRGWRDMQHEWGR